MYRLHFSSLHPHSSFVLVHLLTLDSTGHWNPSGYLPLTLQSTPISITTVPHYLCPLSLIPSLSPFFWLAESVWSLLLPCILSIFPEILSPSSIYLLKNSSRSSKKRAKEGWEEARSVCYEWEIHNSPLSIRNSTGTTIGTRGKARG